MPISNAIMPMTTSNSTRVNARSCRAHFGPLINMRSPPRKNNEKLRMKRSTASQKQSASDKHCQVCGFGDECSQSGCQRRRCQRDAEVIAHGSEVQAVNVAVQVEVRLRPQCLAARAEVGFHRVEAQR